MTSSAELLNDIEKNLMRVGSVSEELCDRAASSSLFSLYRPVLSFIGCQKAASEAKQMAAASDDRMQILKILLLRLRLNTNDPKWSSSILERLVQLAIELSDDTLDDLFRALLIMLSKNGGDLDQSLASFIKDFVVLAFTLHQKVYSKIVWRPILEPFAGPLTAGQAYLILLAVPSSELSATRAIEILKSLVLTRYWTEAAATLSEDLANLEGRSLLKKWSENEEEILIVDRIQELLKATDN